MKYLVQTMIENETDATMRTREQIVDLLKADQISDFLQGIVIYDVSTFGAPRKVETTEFWQPQLTGIAGISDGDHYDAKEW